MILKSLNQPTAVNALNREHSRNCQAGMCGSTTPASRGCPAQPREENHFGHKTHQMFVDSAEKGDEESSGTERTRGC